MNKRCTVIIFPFYLSFKIPFYLSFKIKRKQRWRRCSLVLGQETDVDGAGVSARQIHRAKLLAGEQRLAVIGEDVEGDEGGEFVVEKEEGVLEALEQVAPLVAHLEPHHVVSLLQLHRILHAKETSSSSTWSLVLCSSNNLKILHESNYYNLTWSVIFLNKKLVASKVKFNQFFVKEKHHTNLTTPFKLNFCLSASTK